MERLTRLGCIFFGVAMAAVGFQQFFIKDISGMLFPPLHSWVPWMGFWAYFSGLGLLVVGAAIIFRKYGGTASLILGIILLAVFCFYYIPYQLIVDPYHKYLGEWSDAQKEMALAGGAFAIAGSFLGPKARRQGKPGQERLSGMLVRLGGILFCITMISFGIDHFLYTKSVSNLVPAWIPHPIFWTYFAAVALIGSGTSILLNFKLDLIATLLGIMIFIWLVILHTPRAIASGSAAMGHETTSALSALAFSGIAFVIAGEYHRRKKASHPLVTQG